MLLILGIGFTIWSCQQENVAPEVPQGNDVTVTSGDPTQDEQPDDEDDDEDD